MGNNVVRSFYDPKHAPLLKIGGAVYNLIFMPPRSKIGGILFLSCLSFCHSVIRVVLSFCHSVLLSKTLTLLITFEQ